MPMPVVDIWSRILVGDGCWEWIGSLNRDGYGKFGKNYKGELAHRAAWEYFYGPLPRRSILMHSCDNRKCCNPDHMMIGTHSLNRLDCISKNRQAKGEKMWNALLNEDQIREIKNRRKLGEKNIDIARDFLVDRTTISKIVNGKNWRHVE